MVNKSPPPTQILGKDWIYTNQLFQCAPESGQILEKQNTPYVCLSGITSVFKERECVVK